MRVSSRDPALYLLDQHDVARGELPAHVREYCSHAAQAMAWVQGYLCQPHPALGRDGPVCPYTGPALKRGLFWLTIYPGEVMVDKLSDLVMRYRDWFLALHPTTGREAEYKSLLILLPDVAPQRATDVVDGIQAALRPAFTARGLMIGQFHARCGEPGLWNPRFRPLRSPLPLLAIRYMVRGDAPFLTTDAVSLAGYLRRFGDDVPGRLDPAVRAAARSFGLAYADP